MIDLLGWFGRLIGLEHKRSEEGPVKGLYEQLRVTADYDIRSRLVAQIAARDFGLMRLVLKMPYAVELMLIGARAELDGPDLTHLCGIIALAQYDMLGAQDFLEEARAMAPRDARIRNSLAIAYLESGNTAGALIALNEALSLEPNFIVAQVNLSATRSAFHAFRRGSSP
jgi:tetratricopeptide (TPR) repeat protein